MRPTSASAVSAAAASATSTSSSARQTSAPAPSPAAAATLPDGPRDEEHEKGHRAKIREAQNAGTEAYQKKDLEAARGHFEEALRLVAALNDAARPSKTEPPSRVLAERDAVKVKLLKFLSKAYEKMDDKKRAREIFAESRTIEKRLLDYEKRKREANK